MMEPILLNCKNYPDHRGSFYESFSVQTLMDTGIDCAFVQDNHSVSRKNVVRGLHYQWDEPQAKLVRVSNGSIIDVIVDIRSQSRTYGKVFYYELSSRNLCQLWIPVGFAHGFVSLEDNTHVQYKTSKKYNPAGEGGINPLDHRLNINWRLSHDDMILSDRDRSLPKFEEYDSNRKF